MPVYEYACKACGEHVEVAQSFKDEPLTTCELCGGPLRKVFGSIGVVLKGSGFYRNDSRNEGGARSKADKAPAKAEAASGAGSEGRSDTRSDTKAASGSDTKAASGSDTKSDTRSDTKAASGSNASESAKSA